MLNDSYTAAQPPEITLFLRFFLIESAKEKTTPKNKYTNEASCLISFSVFRMPASGMTVRAVVIPSITAIIGDSIMFFFIKYTFRLP